MTGLTGLAMTRKRPPVSRGPLGVKVGYRSGDGDVDGVRSLGGRLDLELHFLPFR
jgi:hypothetical protein